MKLQRSLIAILATTMFAAISSSAGAFQSPSLGEQILVLRNGNLQRGKIDRGVGGYTLFTPSGSRIVIASEQVDFVCGSMDEALAIKRRRVDEVDIATGSGIRERIALFHWCLKQGLLDEAQTELNNLQLMEMSAAELNALLRQLHSALARSQPGVTPPNGLDMEGVMQGEIVIAALPDNGAGGSKSVEATSEVKPISFDEHVEAPFNFAANELERLTKQLPVEGVSLYKRRVEPLLFRNCSNAGCHDPNRTRWPLMRGARGDGIPKRMSQQNLVKTLAFLGEGKEGNSPLLAAAIMPHGGGAIPPMKRDSEHYKLLLTWVEFMAPPAKVAGIAQIDSPLFPASKAVEVPEPDSPPSNALPLISRDPAGPVGSESKIQIPEIPSLDPVEETFVPTDPFDPEIFNRKVRQDSAQKQTEKK